MIEKGWLGGGNTGRNTTIIRSNYLWEESAALYEHALKLWKDLSQDLNYNVMYSPRGVMMLAHNVHDVQVFKRHVHANRLNGIDNEWLTPEEAKDFCPILNISRDIRYPILGAALQRRGGIARHDAVAWGYARAADALGVDIIQNCEVTGIRRDRRGAVAGVETTRGAIATQADRRRRRRPYQRGDGDGRRAHAARELSAAGAGLRAGQADHALRRDVQHHPRLHVAIRQGRARHRRRHRRSTSPIRRPAGCTSRRTRSMRSASCSRWCAALRMLRNWGGIVDVTPDRSPIIGKTPVPGLFVNCGWGTGGFKATPGSGHVFAHTVATGEPHPIDAPFTLDRFRTGRLIDEAAAAAVAH